MEIIIAKQIGKKKLRFKGDILVTVDEYPVAVISSVLFKEHDTWDASQVLHDILMEHGFDMIPETIEMDFNDDSSWDPLKFGEGVSFDVKSYDNTDVVHPQEEIRVYLTAIPTIRKQKDTPPRVKFANDNCPALSGQFPNFSVTGSIEGMREKYYGKDALLVVYGDYIYNVSSEPDIYHKHAH